MPELPEVTTITNQLNKELSGLTIESVETVNNYKIHPQVEEFKTKVSKVLVQEVFRIAKNIVIRLKTTELLFIVIHLAMTGRLLLRSRGHKEDPWMRVVFSLSNDKELRFTDSRMFGFVRLMGNSELDKYSSKYGPDALSPTLTSQILMSQLKKRRTSIKKALLEQDLIAGAGNIYVNDSLWMAKIHPETLTSQLDEAQSARLLQSLQEILRESITHRGSTLGDKMYIDIYGAEGEHQNYFRVFGKNGQPCPRCQTIIEYIDIGGRGTFFCPKCQTKPGINNFNLQKSNEEPRLL